MLAHLAFWDQRALAIARAADAKVAGLRDDIIPKNAAAGMPVTLSRANHRREHLDELERDLKSH
jgi:hypothetical protein